MAEKINMPIASTHFCFSTRLKLFVFCRWPLLTSPGLPEIVEKHPFWFAPVPVQSLNWCEAHGCKDTCTQGLTVEFFGAPKSSLLFTLGVLPVSDCQRLELPNLNIWFYWFLGCAQWAANGHMVATEHFSRYWIVPVVSFRLDFLKSGTHFLGDGFGQCLQKQKYVFRPESQIARQTETGTMVIKSWNQSPSMLLGWDETSPNWYCKKRIKRIDKQLQRSCRQVSQLHTLHRERLNTTPSVQHCPIPASKTK